MAIRLIVILSILSLHLSIALASEWEMDTTNSHLNYVASYERVEAPGSFKQFEVSLQFDPQAIQRSQLHVSVDLASVDMGSDDINDAIVQKEWLHVMQFPRATFQSNHITKQDANTYVAHGILNLKGIERAIDVPFTWNKAGGRAQMQGQLVIKRSQFDIGSGEWSSGDVIGMDVKIEFAVELKRAE